MNQLNARPESQPEVAPAHRGDYLLARAKRELERLLRAEGCSKSEALRLVHQQFNPTAHAKECSNGHL